jgi:hypothetical protein
MISIMMINIQLVDPATHIFKWLMLFRKIIRHEYFETNGIAPLSAPPTLPAAKNQSL